TDTFLQQNVNLNLSAISTSEPRLTDFNLDLNYSAQLSNQWWHNSHIGLYDSRWDRGALRGGAALRVDPGYFLQANITTDGRKSVVGFVGMNGYRNPASDSGRYNINTNVSVQARSNIDVSLQASYWRNDDAMQFVEEAIDDTGKSHFVFARINQT